MLSVFILSEENGVRVNERITSRSHEIINLNWQLTQSRNIIHHLHAKIILVILETLSYLSLINTNRKHPLAKLGYHFKSAGRQDITHCWAIISWQGHHLSLRVQTVTVVIAEDEAPPESCMYLVIPL